MIREKVKNLWKLCFSDPEEYVELYFGARYNNEVNIAIQSGEEVIAALQMLPYPMTYEGKEIDTSYISGACTHPDYRARGVMHELLSQAFARMLDKGVAISTLIPAEPWLFDYYARTGYAPVFRCRKYTFKASATALPKGDPILKITHKYKENIYEYLNRQLRKRPNCIQHTKEDFLFVLTDLKFSQGEIYTLNHEGNITALAVAYPTATGGWYIDEIVANTPEMNTILLQRICEKKCIPSVEVCTPPVAKATNEPAGMARIINAQRMLQLYAAAHPKEDANLYVSDEQVSANTGYYYLSNGKCTKSAKRLPGSHLTLTIGELTEKIFASSTPYMSLMLNN